MASNTGKQVIQRVRSLITSTRKLQFQSNITALSPESSTIFSAIAGRRNPRLLSRLPVELGGMQSLMPLHSVTASALLKSMLSSKIGQWGCLSEGKQGNHTEVGKAFVTCSLMYYKQISRQCCKFKS